MKIIEFIAPVESMRGNLSGKQDLVYNDNDNKAFEAPVGRQYAKNYQPRFIGAKRASDNRKYFAVKTRSATLVTVASRKRMAVLGGTGSMIGVILTSISLGGLRDKLEQSWQWEMENVSSESGKTFRKFLTDKIYQMLNVGLPAAEFYTAGPVYQLLNPWHDDTAGAGTSDPTILLVNVPKDILVKFWLELAINEDGDTPIVFTVNGQKGIAFNSWDFDLLSSRTYDNVLGLKVTQDIEGADYVYIGNASAPNYLQLASNYVAANSTVVADAKYTTTTVAPE